MSVLQIVDGDLYLPDGADRLTVLGEPDATLQALRDALKLAVGDWFLDLTVGLDREIMIGKYASLIPPEVELRRVLAAVYGITQVIRVEARRLKTRDEAVSYGTDTLLAWDAAPRRILYITAQVTSRVAGTLDLGLPLPIPS